MNFTVEELRNFSDKKKLALFMDLGELIWSTPDFATQFAEATGWTNRAVHAWRQKTNPVPVPALCILQHIYAHQTPDMILLNTLAELHKAFVTAATQVRSDRRRIMDTLREPPLTRLRALCELGDGSPADPE